MATVEDFIRCPKCGKQMMKESNSPKFGMEYFAQCCHLYFGVNELVNQFGYDAADLTPVYPVTHANYKNWIPKGNYPYRVQVAPISFFSPEYYEVETGEPYWLSGNERNSAYQIVSRMFLDIPEFDDHADLMNTQMDALGVGLQ